MSKTATKSKRRLIASFLSDFADWNALKSQRKQVRNNVRVVERFCKATGARHLYDLTTERIEEYVKHLQGQGRATNTISTSLGSISAFVEFLRTRGYLESNPVSRASRPRIEKRLPIFLDEEECSLALKLAKANGIYCEVCLALNTGLRRGELGRLEWRDIDFSRRALVIRKSKSGRPRMVWLNSAALDALREQRNEFPDTRYVFPRRRRGKVCREKKRGIDWWLKALRPLQAAIPKFQEIPKGSCGRGWHLFRHTFASQAVQAGVSILKVSHWLGHSNVTTTQIYAHLSPDFDTDIERVMGGNGNG